MSYLELMVSVGGALWERAASMHSGGQLLWLASAFTIFRGTLSLILSFTVYSGSLFHPSCQALGVGQRASRAGGPFYLEVSGGFAGEVGLEG